MESEQDEQVLCGAMSAGGGHLSIYLEIHGGR